MRFTVTFYLLLLSVFSFAQDDSEKEYDEYYSGLLFRVYDLPTPDLNSILNGENIGGLASEMVAIGFFFSYSEDESKWENQSVFNFFVQDSENEASSRANQWGLGFEQNVGYKLVHAKNFHLTPFVGIGFDFYRLNILRNVGNGDLAGILQNNYQKLNFDIFDINFPVGLRTSTHFDISKVQVNLGLQAGYRLSFNPDYTIDGIETINASSELGGLFVGVSFGINFIKED